MHQFERCVVYAANVRQLIDNNHINWRRIKDCPKIFCFIFIVVFNFFDSGDVPEDKDDPSDLAVLFDHWGTAGRNADDLAIFFDQCRMVF
jgi:hypothetical protein